MLSLIVLRCIIGLVLAGLGYYFVRNLIRDLNSKSVKEGSKVMIVETGFEGKVIEVVKYEDITLYGVRMGNEILHYKREQLIKRS